MKKSVEIEVNETIEDYIQFLLKTKSLITFPLLLIAMVILMGTNEKRSILTVSNNTDLTYLIVMIIFVIASTIGVHIFLISNYKKLIKEKPEYANYKIRFNEDDLVILKKEEQKLNYNQINLFQNKKCYFIRYRETGGRKAIILINKEKCSEEGKKAIDFHLKKR